MHKTGGGQTQAVQKPNQKSRPESRLQDRTILAGKEVNMEMDIQMPLQKKPVEKLTKGGSLVEKGKTHSEKKNAATCAKSQRRRKESWGSGLKFRRGWGRGEYLEGPEEETKEEIRKNW